jgi:CRISPR/Cas system-associated exonuclease Cas4 (RecB family)
MHRRILKTPEPRSPALLKGEVVHSKAEQYLLADKPVFPIELALFRKEMDKLREHKALAEEAIVLDSQWQHIPDGWEHEDAWLRLKTDARVDNFIVDFKTGRYYPSHEGQAKLYANALMCIEPSYNEVDVEFWYLDSGMVRSYTFAREDLERDKAEWEARVDKMLSDTEWQPKEHEYCKYCFVRHLCPLKNRG